ncbi:MAG TPA: glycosyltransferase [Puia sp.]|nr:glycosyltransferase [Puia sp.]
MAGPISNDILISVVIPVKDGDYWLEEVLGGLMKQTLIDRAEVIVIDSGSTDRTLEIVSRFPVRLVQIAPAEFNHGSTRNLGVMLAKGEYVVMTVQDAKAADDRWLQKLLDGFDAPDVAGVCGQQIVPHDPDKNPAVWFRPVSPPTVDRYHFADPAEFDRLSPEEKRWVCRWDNVNAMYRREVLLRVPFRAVAFAEDALWAKDALLSGYTIVYHTAARVLHYHFETPDFAFRRSFTVSYHFYQIFGLRPSPAATGLIPILRTVRLLMKAKGIGLKDRYKWLLYNYRWSRAINRSVTIFNRALGAGAKELDRVHADICGIPPQAVKPSSVL